ERVSGETLAELAGVPCRGGLLTAVLCTRDRTWESLVASACEMFPMRASLYDYWYPARDKAGRPDLRFHDLRHTGAVLAASTGATLADLMARLGHSSPATAMRYQHASADRDSMIADRLTEIADGS
ncbi:MAG: tyrosine-type recombinase/integrase, partial [Mycobacterium sp.]|nr:tyrosine-type recombinase/integrase [Mycobacterium sp.]